MTESCFDLNKFKAAFTDEQKDLVLMAKTAEATERYEDMCKFMRELVHSCDTNGRQLDVEGRNLLSVAYKNVIGARRASWRTLTGDLTSSDAPNAHLIGEYKRQVEEELSDICKDILELLENKLIVNSKGEAEEEARVFYLKMTGDYYRYLAESVKDKDYDDKAAEFYRQAFVIAKSALEPTHPIRLGLALNYSVCHYEILKDKDEACKLAKEAFDQAIAKLDKLEEADYKDSTLIMQLLRDNLTLWTSDDGDDSNLNLQDVSDAEED